MSDGDASKKEAKPTPFAITPTSPYFVHPSEGSGILITAVIFNGDNYDLWEKAITTALRSKNKLGFINGRIQEPTIATGCDPFEVDAWEMVNSTICSLLLNVVDPKIRPSIAYANTAKVMWDDLKKRYGVSDIPKIHDLKSKIANCKQGSVSVVEYYARLVGLWNELEAKATQHLCTCGKCECKLGEKLFQVAEQEKAHQFLMGLDDEKFGRLRSQILAMEPLPSLDKIFNTVRQEEHHKDVINGQEVKGEVAAAFAVNAKNRPSFERPTCKHCGRQGHEESACYELVGYPAGWGSRGRGRGVRAGRGTRGGRQGAGRGRNSGREGAYAVTTTQETSETESKNNEQTQQVTIPGLTADQVQRLMVLIDTPKSGHEKLSGPYYEDSDWYG